ncbi:MAG: putative manganese-dependent inorganic diphosphatase [Atopobiaceae bacterium]|nr:putative manganese-dependent inorganic diphosphatase [Atopobiaceae bacterium]
MPEAIRKVNIIGHLNPDTDSICSAIAYSYLKSKIDPETVYEARRAGAVNRETAFVLKHFGHQEPALITTVTPQIKDIEITKQSGIDGETSLFVAWRLMREVQIDTLCITDHYNNLDGLITVKDIANANMDIFNTNLLATARTRYLNIIETLNGTMVLGDIDGAVEAGDICIGTTPSAMDGVVKKGDTVLVTNSVESQLFAIERGAGCLIACCGAEVKETLVRLAKESNCTIITTPLDTYAAARLISMSIPVRAKMLDHDIINFTMNTPLEVAQQKMSKTRHRFFPVKDREGRYVGMVSAPNMTDPKKKHVILVDHAERAQTVDGIEEAEIMEIIDHHRVGNIETNSPLYYRCQPVGCTCTIIYEMYQEQGVEIPPSIAGLMMSAILSDTLCFRSPTCTPHDVEVARSLAEICGEDPEEFADAMFDAGADLTGRTADELFNADFKVFSRGNISFGVGQGSYMTEGSRKDAEALLEPYMEAAAKAKDVPMIFYMFTDIKNQSTDMLCYGAAADIVLARAFGIEPKDGLAVLPGVVSRKKQVIPALMGTLQTMEQEN